MPNPAARTRYPGYTPAPQSRVPRDDPNRYDRLSAAPAATYAPGFDSRLFRTWKQAKTPAVLLKVTASAFLATQLTRLFGVYLLTPFLVPFWFLFAVLTPLSIYRNTGSLARAVHFTLGEVTIFFGVVVGSAVPTGPAPRLAAGLGAVLILGVFVDQLAAHALEWRMRRRGVPTTLRRRWMRWWRHRFDRNSLTQAIAARALSPEPLAALETQYLREIARYPMQLLLLPLLTVLLLLPHALLAFLTLPAAAIAIACLRAPPPPLRALVFVTAQAFQGFLRYAPTGDHVLGQWKSPAGAYTSRHLIVTGVVFAMAGTFLPLRSYVDLLGSALLLNLRAVWRLAPMLLFEPLIPLAIVISAVIICLGRLLWSVEQLCPSLTKGWTP